MPSNPQNAPQVDMSQVKRALIVKLSAIGDVVHAIPVSAALKKAYPDLHLSWLIESRCSSMVKGNPYIDEVIEFPRHKWKKERWKPRTYWEQWQFSRDLKARRFDLAIDLQGLLKSALMVKASGAKYRVGWHNLREGAHLFAKPFAQRPESVHVVEQYLDVAYFLGAQTQPIEFPLLVTEEEREKAKILLQQADIDFQEPFLIFNPATGRDYKTWKFENYAALADHMEGDHGIKTLFIGGPTDSEVGEQIAKSRKMPNRSLIGKTSLKELAALLGYCSAHVCGDTGSGHIASALGIKCVAIFGPTAPERSCPYGQLATTLSKASQCQTCAPEKCERKECINWVTVEEVESMLLKVLRGETPPISYLDSNKRAGEHAPA